MSYLELSRLGLEAVSSYLDLSGEGRAWSVRSVEQRWSVGALERWSGERWSEERGAESGEGGAGDVEAEKVHGLYLEREGAISGNW